MTSTLFLISFGSYLLFLAWVGWFVSRKKTGSEDFLLGGRQLPFFLTLGTTVATLVGTGSSMGAVGFSYENGWAGTLYGIGGAAGMLLCAWFFAPARKLRFITMSEELSYYVGANRHVKNVVGCLILVASIGWLGAHILGGGTYLSRIVGIDIQTAKILIAFGFTVYILIGGYTAVVWIDSLQAIILFSGFLLLAYMAITSAGGYSAVIAAQPPERVSLLGIEHIGALPGLSLALVICIGVLATPSYRQRIYSARSTTTARKSFVFSGILYLIFSSIPAIVGMSAFALNPELDNRNFSFPYLASSVLPVGLGIVVLIAGLSATMSSASSDAIAGVATMMRDISVLVTKKVPEQRNMVFYSRISIVFIVAMALGFALISDDIIGYITNMIATLMTGLFVCGFLGRFWPRFNWQGSITALASASVTSLFIISNESWLAYWGNPVIPSVSISIVSSVIASLITPPNTINKEQALALLTIERTSMENHSKN